MTAILTKQNALDGAFMGGSKNPSSINCDEINAKTADIEQDLTVGGDINLGGISLKSQLINHAQALSVISSDINDHEERITSLEMSPGSVNELSYEDGLDAYSLDLNSLSKVVYKSRDFGTSPRIPALLLMRSPNTLGIKKLKLNLIHVLSSIDEVIINIHRHTSLIISS